jgi:hypothetical protein
MESFSIFSNVNCERLMRFFILITGDPLVIKDLDSFCDEEEELFSNAFS